ncbi:hypothetical protein [Variovorax sp. YR216]|uniref:hypothetical protein n=1 Tax=Variovorax sp. YR216 TaxID=1882828 RepID=UPI00089915B1|nr:hypothetical protein [Variovorax sp. YR216]SEB25433.1 hypothetical protein SAMN05444680_12536 [Variovorax sp. YR216]
MVNVVQGQHRRIFPDEADGIAYWSFRDWKKWAVHIVAGPAKRPTYKRTAYVRARTAQAAISVARREVYPSPPRSARFDARMVGPRELG